MTKGTLVRLGVLIGLGFATGFLLVATPASGGDETSRVDFARIIGVSVWLLGCLILAAIAFVYGRLLLRRRHLMELEVFDVSTEPLPMSPKEQAWAAQLASLGFHFLGESELRPRYDSPLRFWVYATDNGIITAEISRRWQRVSFSSAWEDGTGFTTTSAAVPRASFPHYLRQSADGVESAYRLHLQTGPNFGVGHGTATLIRSMADYIAQERRQHQLVTPEIMAHQRWRGHVMTCAIIAVFAVALVTLRPF